jgi:hypothetical protein
MSVFVDFLTALGFTEVRRLPAGDSVELFVAETLKAARKKLKSRNIRFQLVDSSTTSRAVVHDFYAIEQKRTVGRVTLTSYPTHSIIKLTDLTQ